MKRLFFILLLFFLMPMALAETIKLSDRSVIRAKIIERTGSSITVNMDGVKMTYLSDEITSIDGDPGEYDEDIPKLLKARRYPEYAWPGITRELETFLVNINFPSLKNKIIQAQGNPEELRLYVAELGRSIRQQGCLNLRDPHLLIRLLVNGLGHEDILSIIESSSLSPEKKEEEKREIFACSAISQLASIILDLIGIDARITIAPGHVFNSIPLERGRMLFADFSNEVFEIVDVGAFYRTDGRYQVLKEQQRLAPKHVLEINEQWDRGFTPTLQRELLNLYLYFYIYMTNNNAATAILYTNRGNDYEFKGNLNKALANYAQALGIDPDLAGVHCDRGLVFADAGNFNRAIMEYNKALEINPNDIDAYNDRGLAYKNQRNFIQAIADYNKALEINPNSAQVYDNLGNAYSVQGDFNQGIINYTKAIELDPDDVMGYKNRAACHYYLKQYLKAREDARKAEELGYRGA
jgi:Flp pilus assembly protein TadD